jgi:hypothetical protein
MWMGAGWGRMAELQKEVSLKVMEMAFMGRVYTELAK